MKIWRGNSYAELHGASGAFLATLARHLAVPIEPGTKRGKRFGARFEVEGQLWGSLVHGNRVASGLTWYVQRIAEEHGVPCELHDVRERPECGYPWFSVSAKWRPYQDLVHEQVKRYEIGVVDAPPRSGKTLMAARAIDVLGQPTVMLAPSVAIVKQSYEVFVKHFGYDLVARLDGDATTEEKDLSKPIVIATAQSAVRQPREWWDTRRMLVIDEFHHAAADTYHQINDLARTCYFRLMFTGTHFRTGEDRLAMEAICSQVLHKVGISELVDAGFLAPPRVVYAPVQAQSLASGDWQKVYRHCIVESEERNHLVSHVARTLAGNGIPTIVLVRHIKHAYTLKDMIPNSTVVKGGESALTGKSIEEFRQGSIPVLIGTTVIGEGVDLPNAGALVYASAGGSGVQQMQSYFRPLTAAPGKAVGLIYDFMDNHHATLSRWSRDRMSFTRSHLGEHSVVEL